MTLTGNHLIAGKWVGSTKKFTSQPIQGNGLEYSSGSDVEIDQAVTAAEEAFMSYSALSRAKRAEFLRAIASEIDSRGDQLTQIGSQETGLPEARLNGERGRTVGQLRLFADHIEKGEYLDRRHDKALPDREPLPRPELKLIQKPVGPVAVFGASNFPLAFSVAGGDTASALAAGCSVVVKGHAAHPGTSEIVADAINSARSACDIHPGVFSLIQGETNEVGASLVQHPLIKAVGFTGSLAGGRALFDLCCRRPEPIPFFGELGSINPVFLLPDALTARSQSIAEEWAVSLTMGAGQYCTNPGVVFMLDGKDTDKFIDQTKQALTQVNAQTMLTDRISQTYESGVKQLAKNAGVESVLIEPLNSRDANPSLLTTSGAQWLSNETLAEEVFGPLGIVVRVEDQAQLVEIASRLQGQLTCTLQMEDSDASLAQQLIPWLERKAGRILANGFPTGVEVCDAMVHGGPYPASTNFGATSVGTMAIRRFLRPVSYQNILSSLLPDDLQ